MKVILTLFFCILLSASTLAAIKFTPVITGISGDALENAQKSAQHLLELHEEIQTKEQLQQVFEQITPEIKQSLSPFGYFKPEVQSGLAQNRSGWVGTYFVIPGPRVRIISLTVHINGDGLHDIEFQKLRRNFPIKVGQPLDSPQYVKAKDTLLDLAATRGYFDAHMKASTIKINRENNTAEIYIEFNTGKRYRFGVVNFVQINEGAKPLSYRFLSRYVEFKSTEYFDQKQLFNLQEQLRLSHYFDHVTIKPEPEKHRNFHVPITITVYASKAKRYQFGLGAGTDTGLRAVTGVIFRRLTSDGHFMELNAKGSIKQYDLLGKADVSYNIPGHRPSKDLWKFTAQVTQDQDDETGISTNTTIGGSYISEIYGWQQSLNLAYQLENSRPVDQEGFSTNILIPGINWSRIFSDDPIKPNFGYRLSGSVRGAAKNVLSDTSFTQAQIHAKGMTTLGDSFRVIGRVDFGMVGIDNIDDLPLSIRFTAGGTETVRGYGYRDIKDGRTMSVASLELQKRLYPDIYSTAFFDAGDIGPSFFADIKRGVGLGLLWRSPIGALELTLAQAIDKPGQPRRLELSMGSEL